MIITVTPNPVLDRTITVPALAFNEVLRATAVRLDWGGKGFNVSRALLALGAESVAMGFVGGATGDMLETGLHAQGIATDFVRIDGETRTNVVIAEPGGRHIKANEAGPTVPRPAQEALFAALRARLQPGDTCVMAGSLPPGVDADFYAELVRLVRAAGALAVLDASGDALRRGVAAGPDLVKPNTLEAEQLTGAPVRGVTDAVAACDAIGALGAGMVALSLGADGLVLSDGAQTVHAQPPAIEEVINVGAGDALVAGLVWAQTQGMALPEIARWGVACGTAAAQKPGVDFGTRDEVTVVAAQVRNDKIED